MGVYEQNDIMALREQIRQIQWRLDELEGGNHIVDVNKKVAVYAPEPWMKEKVAKVWNLKTRDPIGGFPYTIQSIANPEFIGNILKANDEEFERVDFQDFCKQHGISDKPDYVKSKDLTVIKVEYWDKNEMPCFHSGISRIQIRGWQPATEKEYLEQESEKKPE